MRFFFLQWQALCSARYSPNFFIAVKMIKALPCFQHRRASPVKVKPHPPESRKYFLLFLINQLIPDLPERFYIIGFYLASHLKTKMSALRTLRFIVQNAAKEILSWTLPLSTTKKLSLTPLPLTITCAISLTASQSLRQILKWTSPSLCEKSKDVSCKATRSRRNKSADHNVFVTILRITKEI